MTGSFRFAVLFYALGLSQGCKVKQPEASSEAQGFFGPERREIRFRINDDAFTPPSGHVCPRDVESTDGKHFVYEDKAFTSIISKFDCDSRCRRFDLLVLREVNDSCKGFHWK